MDGRPSGDGRQPRFGPFRAERILGRGGMGEVHLARDGTGRRAAVKVVHSFLARDGEFRARFRHEAAAMGAVDSPYAAALLAADPEAERPWLASAYVEGPTLGGLLRDRGPLGEQKLRALTASLTRALGAIHGAGLVHRDLKPSNVIVGAGGPCVIDFGIAHAADATRLTGTGVLLGTAGYAAPEQLTEGVSAPAGDVFALGAVLATAATGRRPFGDGPPHVAAYRTVHAEPDLDGVPEDLLPLIAACLAKDPAGRPDLDALATAGPAEEVSWAAEAAAREEDAEEDWNLAPPVPRGGPEATVRLSRGAATPAPAAPALPPPPGPPPTSPPPAGFPLPRARRPWRRAAAAAGAAVAVVGCLTLLAVLALRGGDGDDTQPVTAPTSTPVTNPSASGEDRELPTPASLVPGVSLAAGPWTPVWDNLTPEPEAGQDVNEVRGADLVATWLTDDAVIRVNEKNVRAYALDDGREIWKARPPKKGLVPCAASHTTAKGVGAVAFGRSPEPDKGCDTLAAIQLDDGTTAWHTTLRPEKRVVETARTTVGIAGGRVVAHSYSGIVGYDLRNGRAVWLRSWRDDGCGLADSRAARATVAVIDVCSGEAADGAGDGADGDDGRRVRVRQLNASDGTVRWATRLDENVTSANVETVQPVSIRLFIRDSDELPLQVFAADGTAPPPLAADQPFGKINTSSYGAFESPDLFAWKNTVVTTYSTGPENHPRWGVAAVDTRTGKVRWHRLLNGMPELFGLDDDGVLLTEEGGFLGGLRLIRMDLDDGDTRGGGTLPARATGPVGVLLAREDTVVVFPSLDIAEGAAVLAAPDA